MIFYNVYEDAERARSYANLKFPGTYYLAFRDLPEIIARNVSGEIALDFGCGTGRSTRFLSELSFSNVVGVDISAEMISRARFFDQNGDYRLVPDGDLSSIPEKTYDLILSAFTFDNIPSSKQKIHLLKSLHQKLKSSGKLVNLVSAPEIYHHEWVSFSTREFPENRTAQTGDSVKIIMLDVDDKRPVEDILCTDSQYRKLYQKSKLKLIDVFHPLGKATDPIKWKTETQIAPWTIYLLGKN